MPRSLVTFMPCAMASPCCNAVSTAAAVDVSVMPISTLAREGWRPSGLLLRRSKRYALSSARITVCNTFQATSLPFTVSSVRYKPTSFTPVGCSALNVVRTTSRNTFSPNSSSLPSPISNTRLLSMPEIPCNNSVVFALPSISP
ncbi:MAG: hypothetical protein JNIBNLAF_02370 [Nitrosomonas europaea]|nr:hypothetical protein [Nitrosomonas europaea]